MSSVGNDLPHSIKQDLAFKIARISQQFSDLFSVAANIRSEIQNHNASFIFVYNLNDI